jgi:nucleoside-triphosphatase THEP1
MEILSPAFRRVVNGIFTSPAILLGSIVRRSTPFGDQIKARSDVALIEISPKNRASLLEHVLALIEED